MLVDHRRVDSRTGIGLPEADDTLVGMDADEQQPSIIVCDLADPAGLLELDVREAERLDASDLHANPPRCGYI